MACNKALNIKNVPMNATWEIEEAYCLSTAGLTINDLKGKYFLVYNQAGEKFKGWFDDGVVAEPTVASSFSVPIDISAATTPALIATAIKAGFEAGPAAGYLWTIKDSTTVRATYAATNVIPHVAENGTAGELLELTQVQVGGSIDLGLLDGDVTFDPSVETQDITAHQTGAIILGQNITGLGGTVSLTLKEYLPSRYRKLYEAVGGKVATTTVVGMGSAMVGKNLLLFAKRLKLKPVNAVDETTTYTFWKSIPDLGSHTFSGENPTTLPLEFTAYIDDAIDTNVNVWAYGDVSTLP